MSRVWQRAKQVRLSPEAAAIGSAAETELAQLSAQFPYNGPLVNARRVFESLTNRAKLDEIHRLLGGMSLFDQAMLLVSALSDDETARLLRAPNEAVQARLAHLEIVKRTQTEALTTGTIDLSRLPARSTIQLDLYPIDDFAEADGWDTLHIDQGYRPVVRMKLNANEDTTFKVLTVQVDKYGLIPTTLANQRPQEQSNILIGSPDMAAQFGINTILYWNSEVVYAPVDLAGEIQDRQALAVRETSLGLGGAWMNGVQLFSETAVAQQLAPPTPNQ